MFASFINVKLGSLRCSRAVTAKKCTKTRDARAMVLFCLSRVVRDRLNSLTGYLVYTEPFNIFARFTRTRLDSEQSLIFLCKVTASET